MEDSHSNINPSACPLCGEPNDCQAAKHGHHDVPCWCRDVIIPKKILALVPPEAINRACICLKCLGDTSKIKIEDTKIEGNI